MRAARGERDERRRRARGGARLKLLVFLVVVFACAALAWMALLPFVVTKRIQERTGFEATLERLVANPFTGDFEATGLRLRNPAEFPVREFIEVRTLRANLRLRSLGSARTEFDAVTIDVGTITLVKGPTGAINAERFAAAAETARSTRRPFRVRTLRLKVDRLMVVDHSRLTPTTQEQALNVNAEFPDVTEIQAVANTPALQPLGAMAEVLLQLVPGEFGTSVDELARSGAGLLNEVGRKAGEGVKGFFDALEESKKP